MGFRAVSTNGFATPFIYSSYTECLARVNSFGAGLERLNLVEKNEDGILVVRYYSLLFCYYYEVHEVFCFSLFWLFDFQIYLNPKTPYDNSLACI